MKRKLSRLILYTLGLSCMMALSAQAQTDVHVLDVGQGLSVFVESDGHCMLFDGGDRDKSSYVVSYLKREGVASLDYVIASHYDADHLNGVVGALNVFPVSQVIAPDYTADTRVFQSFQTITEKKAIPVLQPEVGQTYQLGSAAFQILAPNSSGYEDVNDYSVAIRIQDGANSFLITGDAETKSEAEITASGLNLDSDVYVMGHHGSGTSSSWELLQASTPEYAVLSCGAGNAYGHPHAEAMEKLQAMGVRLFRTDKQGVIIGSTDGSSITWNVAPCDDYTPGNANDIPAQPQSTAAAAAETAVSSETAAVTAETSYILNTSSKKIHVPTCKSVKAMSEKNKRSTAESRDALIAQGYTPCKNCNP